MAGEKPVKKRRGFILAVVLAVVSLLMAWSGLFVTLLGYSWNMTDAHVHRIRIRTDLLSLTNAGFRYLDHELKNKTRPRAPLAETNENLTDFNSLRIFSSNDSRGGSVDIFDLEYHPENVNEAKINPLSWGPACPYGYLIRATVKNKKTASFIMETVFVIVPDDTPEEKPTFRLEKKPLFWRELLR